MHQENYKHRSFTEDRTDKKKGRRLNLLRPRLEARPRIYPERQPLELHLQPKLNRPRATAADDGVRGGNVGCKPIATE
jgi:hypothetical protein